jgi:predicted O-methyltransferase YrrM
VESTESARVASESQFHLKPCPHPLVEEIYTKRMIPVAGGQWEPMDVFIPRDQGNLLYSLVRQAQPDLTVEVGMANGLSTLFIASGLEDNEHGRHIAIDPFQSTDWKSAAVTLMGIANLDHRVELIEKYSHQALPELEQYGRRAQFIFVDGSHLFDYVLCDFLCADRILETGGLMAFDDSDWPAIAQVLRYVVANRRYEIACPEVIIESPAYHPTAAGRVLRALGRVVPALGKKLRPDVLAPSYQLGIRGRCVVLRKLGEDDRDGQSLFHHAF